MKITINFFDENIDPKKVDANEIVNLLLEREVS